MWHLGSQVHCFAVGGNCAEPQPWSKWLRELCREEDCSAGCHCRKVIRQKCGNTTSVPQPGRNKWGSLKLPVRLNGTEVETGDEKLVAPCPAADVLTDQDTTQCLSFSRCARSIKTPWRRKSLDAFKDCSVSIHVAPFGNTAFQKEQWKSRAAELQGPPVAQQNSLQYPCIYFQLHGQVDPRAT